MGYSMHKITEQKARETLVSIYGLHGTATPLPGERDFNFKVKVDGVTKYILKISRPGENLEYLEYQQALLQYIEHKDRISPVVIKDLNNQVISTISDDYGNTYFVRLLSWVAGRLWNVVNPHSPALRFSLGSETGKLTGLLQGFNHPQAQRSFEWDIAQGLWTFEHLKLFDKEERQIVTYFLEHFKAGMESYASLRKSVVHNDANDHNIIVTEHLTQPKVRAVIDFGDAIYTQIINDLAVTCAYAMMHYRNPLEASLAVIKGYHSQFPLTAEDLAQLYNCIAIRLIISVTKSAINKQKEPDNTYLVISEKPAWELIRKWRRISPEFAEYSFRHACGFTPHPRQPEFESWLKKEPLKLTNLFPAIQKKEIHRLDLSIESTWLGHSSEYNDPDIFQFKIDQLQKKHPKAILAGGYCEPRPLYNSDEYTINGNFGRENRTIHLGIDFWLPSATPVHAPFEGEVMVSVNDAGDKEYGGLIILKHQKEDFVFYTLYGHLSIASIHAKKRGDYIKKGACIGYLGIPPENGNWAPHLHFQIMLSMLHYTQDFPGVAFHSEIAVWKSICPDPNLLFRIENLNRHTQHTNQEIITYRKKHLGKSLSLHYDVPIKMVRGEGVYLIDQYGNKYLDTVNNVAHVGHEHPDVVRAGQQQMALLNTNSRYLHEKINDFARELIETLPPELSVLHFVNSGSEANELAIRMVKTVTGSRDIIASEAGYHGNSNMCIDISSYKFEGKGGFNIPEHTHIIPIPDTFRGKYTDTNAAHKYADEVKKQIKKIHQKGRKVGAFIIEPVISCGGQIELPGGFLPKAYQYIRESGGLCISDEVQTGCGRMGKTFWGFQLHQVIPDIVTIGKPLGNGHPLAAVACTREVADKFANGMEYFNTFGGNPVSCAIGTAVLQTVKREALQENARKTGNYLKKELQKLAVDFPIIGDVRGEGLFLGIELVNTEKSPLASQTAYLANRMKDHKILMNIDGPDLNVLKIKPPLVFSMENAKELLFYLSRILKEDFMQLKFIENE